MACSYMAPVALWIFGAASCFILQTLFNAPDSDIVRYDILFVMM